VQALTFVGCAGGGAALFREDVWRNAAAIVCISFTRTRRPTRSRSRSTFRLWHPRRRCPLPHGEGRLFAICRSRSDSATRGLLFVTAFCGLQIADQTAAGLRWNQRLLCWVTMMRKLAVVLTLAVAASACTAASNPVTGPSAVTPEDPGTNMQGDVSLSLVGPAETPRGAVVPFAVRLQNITSRTIRLGVGGITPAFDVIVQDASGRTVWNFMHGKAVAMILKYLTLAPGEVVELKGEWSQQTNDGGTVPPGVYTVHATMWTENGSLRSPTGTLRVR
jgi:hypothetical protein